MGAVKNHYFNEINGLDENGNPVEPYPTEEEYLYPANPDEPDTSEEDEQP